MRKCWMRRNLTRSCCGISSCYPRWLEKLINKITVQSRVYYQILSYNSTLHHICFPLPFVPQVTRVDGDKILPYRSDLVQILQLTLHLKCKQGYILACNLLHHILRSTALLYPTEYCSVPGGFKQPISDYLPIKVITLTELEFQKRTV